MIKRVLIFLILIITIFATASAQDRIATIKAQAMYMVRALVEKDFQKFTDYIHPALVAAAGGREQLIQRMDTANNVAKRFGAEIRRILIGNPGPIVSYSNELQATLPQTTEMRTPFGNLVLETTLIAISRDNGRTWAFVDTSIYNVNEIKSTLPNLSPELIIPPQKPPQFTPLRASERKVG